MSEKESRVLGPESTGYKAPRWAWWVATGFGSGLLKPAPGTWGSLAAVVVWDLGFHLAWRFAPGLFAKGWLWLGVLPCMAMTWLAIRASDRVVQETAEKDPSFIVADEWVGQWIALIPLWCFVSIKQPPGWFEPFRLVVPLTAFRLFDIWKPGMIRDIQALKGGLGVVIDDVIAGFYAALVTYLWMAYGAR